jgi:hypothetical protein
MLISAPASFVVNQFLYPSLSYDPDTSFSPVSLVAQFPNVLVVHPSVGDSLMANFWVLITISLAFFFYGLRCRQRL